MFSNLSKGNVLYGLDRTDKIKWFTATVENVTPTMGAATPNMFGQMPEIRLDIICNIIKLAIKEVSYGNYIS
jgi:hypothetical protein